MTWCEIYKHIDTSSAYSDKNIILQFVNFVKQEMDGLQPSAFYYLEQDCDLYLEYYFFDTDKTIIRFYYYNDEEPEELSHYFSKMTTKENKLAKFEDIRFR